MEKSFWGRLYSNYNKEPYFFGNYLGPYIRFDSRSTRGMDFQALEHRRLEQDSNEPRVQGFWFREYSVRGFRVQS